MQVYLFMSVSLVYLTYLCQMTIYNNGDPGARAAAAGAVMLVIVQVSLAESKKKSVRDKKKIDFFTTSSFGPFY